MRIAFYSDSATFGGHEMMALRAAAGLSRRGHDVLFIHVSHNERLRSALDSANRSGSRIQTVGTGLAGLRLHTLQAPLRWGRLRAFRRLLLNQRIDHLVLVQGHIESGASMVIAARLAGLQPVSYMPMAHDLSQIGVTHLPRLRDWTNRWYYRAIGRFVTISAGAVQDLQRKAPQARCAVVENVIVPPAESLPVRAMCRSRLGLPTDAALLGMIGRVSFEQKGHDLMLQALVTAPGLQRVRLVVVGDGPDLARLHQLAERLGVTDRLIVLAWTSSEMDTVYGALDALALPSRYEGVPLVMMEALARGVPVIASNCDGMATWLPPRALFQRDSPSSIAAAYAHATAGQAADYLQAFEHARARTDESVYAAEWETALQSLAVAGRP